METRRTLWPLIVLSSFFGVAAPPALSQVVWNVPGNFMTIQEAIDAAKDGDSVVVDPGTYTENIDFLGKAITVRSNDPDPTLTTINGGGRRGASSSASRSTTTCCPTWSTSTARIAGSTPATYRTRIAYPTRRAISSTAPICRMPPSRPSCGKANPGSTDSTRRARTAGKSRVAATAK